ncbi:F510_1955 family glycosylhydrolase [Neobacillus ginsengisoli]|uniref:Sortilin N-terminal domain-containing protein n=1 Tax=Neobacillus ginsengisoli TaxID=904295 RepID=A0ABT9XNS8_9BACI|nr:sialidase family protein [Neobacillus ginsengisoli]MDQ0197212.1 hypothetical protein [Neobacillus ginsengisoli]
MTVQKKVIFALITGMLLAAAGCSSNSWEQKKTQQISKVQPKFEIVQAKTINLKVIQGIGFPGNDNALYVASDKGLKIFKDSKWYETTADLNNYLGFQAIETGFLASGHPRKGTDLKDPLGLVESTDKGKTLKNIAFYGKNNFHFISASFSGKDIYVLNEQQDKDLNYGVNYSTDDGKTWKKSTLKNFKSDSLGMIAVHPKNGDIMAMATRAGIYYSEDNGNTMKLTAGPFMVTALTFSGDRILYSSVVENYNILLNTANPKTGEQGNIAIPFLDQDNPITYIAVNPKNENQIAFTTYKNDLYESLDRGKNWSTLLKDGKIEQE